MVQIEGGKELLKRDSLFVFVEFQSLRKTIIKHHRCGILRPVALSHDFFPREGQLWAGCVEKTGFLKRADHW
ncbi:hypothetical protein [Pseudomonas amygdali]|uniref:hypothetical protein n=1 Tax=Pseudomonas amygdali TaxID=47877 RepID=UPI00137A1CF1|nr:hypothetical protein [Pseudomonas amygdali]